MFRILVAGLALFVCHQLFAQTSTPPASSSLPLSQPPSVARAEPKMQLGTFFETLKQQKLDAGVDGLLQGTLLAEQKPQELKLFVGQMKSAFEFYGYPVQAEFVSEQKIGESLYRYRYLTRNKSDAPLFWNFLFYKRSSSFEVLTFTFFDDPAKAGF